MEYDPASPTDEPEDCSITMDLSSIPLPGPPISAPSSFLDIPLPSAAPDISFPAEVHSPPHTIEVKMPQSPDTGMDISENESADVVSGPLKFSIKTAKPLSGQDNSGDSSGIFESSKESKTEDAKAMPKLQAMMKRSKPCQLPVGVLPSKTKLPHVEAKSELFLPSKDSDANGNALLENPPQVPLLPTNISTSLNSIMDSTDTLFNNGGVVNLSTALIDPIPVSLPSISDNTASLLSNLGLTPASLSSLMSNVLPGVGPTSSYIPNLMSLTVQPVPTINTLPATVSGMPGDPTAILRQPKMNITNMQYVNPQKLRSAQMIATPLIANPALAGQHQSEELSKKRENRRRSRSRSRSRSTSRRRGRYHDSSSSSASSSPRRSTYRSRRRSRSWSRRSRSSSGNYSRKYDSSRYSREKRDYERRRDPRRDRSNSLNNVRDVRRDINSIRRRSRSREPNIKENKRPRSRSPRGRLDQSKDVQSAKESTRSIGKSHSQSNSVTTIKSKDRSSKTHTSPKSERPSENKEKNRSSRSEDERKRTGFETKKSDTYRRQTLADLIDRERSPRHKSRPAKDIISSRPKSTGGRLKSASLSTKASEKVVKKKHFSGNDSDRGSVLGTRSSSSPEPSNDKQISGQPGDSAKSHKSSGRRSHRNSPLKNSVIGADNVGTSTFAQECPTPTVAAESDSMDLESGTESDVASALNHLTNEQILATAQDIETDPETPNKQHRDNYLCQADSVSHDDQGACETENPASALEITHDRRGLSIMNPESVFHEVNSCLSKSSVIDHGDCDHKLKEEEGDCTTEPSSEVDHDRSTHLKLEDSKTGEFKYRLRKRVQKPQNGESELAGCLNVNYLGHINQPISPRSAFAAFPDAPTPEYSHISENDYSLIKSSLVTQSQSSFRASLLGSSNLSHHEMRQWVCDCTLPSSEQISMGLLSCGHGCINRALNIECGSHCLSGKYCGNRQFQQLAYAPSKPVYCGPEKGWGLVATAVIPRNTFVIEYVGEVIDFVEFKRRVRRYERLGRSHHYFMALESDTFIDSGGRGNWARFVNHSCEPNCTTQKWSVDGKIRIGFFSKSEIAENEEITIDYQFVQFGATEQKCYCGTASCSGVMGYTSKQLQDKVRLMDTSMVERRVIRLLQLESFRSAEDITLLLQVMVQECLTRYTRLELLKRLAATDSDICLKLFRQYNGLDMIAAFMCDAEPTDWVLKKQILLCLERIPVSEQKQVQTPSRLMEIVTLWTSDPRYCRSRGSTNQSHSVGQVKESGGGGDETTLPNGHSTIQNNTSVSPCSPGPHVYDPKLVKDGAFNLPFNGIAAASSSDGSKASTDSDTNSTEIPPEGNKPLSSSMEEPNLVGNGDCNGSITIDFSSSVVSSEHPSPTDCELNVEAQSLAEVSESSSTPYVDEEIQGIELIADHDEFSDQSLVQEIQELATKIIERWSKLPWETYRIPRVERQETEEILHGSRSSPLIAWGTVLNDQKEFPTSWRQSDLQRTVKGSKNRSKLNQAAKKMFSGNNPPPNQKSGDLSKAERRRIFEAQVSAAEANKLIEKVASITDPESVDNVRQLLLCSLLAELQQPDGAQGLYFDKPSELAETDAEKSSAVNLLKLLLHTLPPLIARLPPERSLSMITRLCEDMRYESEKPRGSVAGGVEDEIASASGSVGGGPTGTPSGGAQDLPPNWQTAVDATGRTYFYNMQTKVVQWERPTALGVASSSPRAVATTAASSDSFSVDEDTRKRMVKAFSVKVTDHILRLLKPYQLPNCVTGRIVSKGDLVHITKKLSRAFVAKETKRSTRPPVFNDILADRIRSRLTQYMVSHGPVYTRRQKQATTSNTLSSVQDNLSPDFT